MDAFTLRQYKESGDCDEGSHTCVYEYVDVACAEGCAEGACTSQDLCDDGCDTPPAPSCSTPVTLVTYTFPGTCQDGLCTYPATESSCPFGCVDGACQGGTRARA